MRTRERKLSIGAIALTIFGTLSFAPVADSAGSAKGVFKEALPYGISAEWLDPSTGGHPISAHVPLYLLHDALLKPMPEGAYTPCLAESWSISPDCRVYEFKLRKGVKFHNGDSMTADDVVFTFSRYKSAQAKFIVGKTERVEPVNPYLVRIHFKEPFPDFLEYLLPGVTTLGWVVPKKYVEQVGDAGFRKYPIGCGPYKFVEFVPGVRLVGEAFEEFWRKVPNIKRMELLTVPDPSTRLAMLKRGELDVATLMIDVLYEKVRKDPELKVLTPFNPTTFIVYMSAQWDPKSPWSDPRVRKAASLAIDRKTLAAVHFPGTTPSGSLALEGDLEGINFPPDPYEPEKAKKLLAEAGYRDGVQGGSFYPYNGPFWPMGEMVANYWKAVGIHVNTILLDRPALTANREGGKMKGTTFIDTAVAPTIGARLSYLFGSTSYGNSPDVQSLWNRYKQEISRDVRKDLISRIQRLIWERTMFIHLGYASAASAFSLKVKGYPYKIQPLIWFTAPFEDIEMEQ